MAEIVPPPPHGPHRLSSADPATLLLDVIERLAIIEQLNASIITEQDEAKVSRREIHKKLEDINDQVGQVKTDVVLVQSQIVDMKPTLASHERLRLQLTGGAYVVGFLWSIAILSAGFVLSRLWNWVSAALSSPHHHP